MFLTINNEVIGVQSYQIRDLIFTFVAQRLLSYTYRMRIVVAHVDKRLCVFSSEAGNQAMVTCQSIVKNIDWARVQ